MRQYQTESIQRVWTNAQEKWLLRPGQLLRVEMDREPPKLKTLAPKPAEPGH
jgi:hypothetical protein